MKRTFRKYPKNRRVLANTSTRSRQHYVKCTTFTKPSLDEQELEEFEEDWDSYPVKEYFLASPGYYGYGGYGSDWCATYYKLADGRCMAVSDYTGAEFYDSESEMLAAIEDAQESIRDEVAELAKAGELDLAVLDNYDFDFPEL